MKIAYYINRRALPVFRTDLAVYEMRFSWSRLGAVQYDVAISNLVKKRLPSSLSNMICGLGKLYSSRFVSEFKPRECTAKPKNTVFLFTSTTSELQGELLCQDISGLAPESLPSSQLKSCLSSLTGRYSS